MSGQRSHEINLSKHNDYISAETGVKHKPEERGQGEPHLVPPQELLELEQQGLRLELLLLLVIGPQQVASQLIPGYPAYKRGSSKQADNKGA